MVPGKETRGTPQMSVTGIPYPAKVHVRAGLACCCEKGHLFFLFSSEGLFPTTSFSKGEESQPRAKSLSFLSWFY